MDKLSNLALISQMIDAAEKNIKSARHLLNEMMGGKTPGGEDRPSHADRAQILSVSEGGKIIEGVFDGQNMVGPDGKLYPIPANYASKSKLVEGDVLKLTISEDGSFIYKQIGPIERRKVIGILSKDDKGDYKVVADGRTYKVLLASLTYFKSEIGDQVTIILPKDSESEWAAVENVIKNGQVSPDLEMSGGTTAPKRTVVDDERELDEI